MERVSTVQKSKSSDKDQGSSKFENYLKQSTSRNLQDNTVFNTSFKSPSKSRLFSNRPHSQEDLKIIEDINIIQEPFPDEEAKNINKKITSEITRSRSDNLSKFQSLQDKTKIPCVINKRVSNYTNTSIEEEDFNLLRASRFSEIKPSKTYDSDMDETKEMEHFSKPVSQGLSSSCEDGNFMIDSIKITLEEIFGEKADILKSYNEEEFGRLSLEENIVNYNINLSLPQLTNDTVCYIMDVHTTCYQFLQEVLGKFKKNEEITVYDMGSIASHKISRDKKLTVKCKELIKDIKKINKSVEKDLKDDKISHQNMIHQETFNNKRGKIKINVMNVVEGRIKTEKLIIDKTYNLFVLLSEICGPNDFNLIIFK